MKIMSRDAVDTRTGRGAAASARSCAAGHSAMRRTDSRASAAMSLSGLFLLLFRRPLPALAGLLRRAAQSELAGRRVFADGGACAHRDGREQLRVGADEDVVFDDGLEFIGAVVIAGDGAGADIDAPAYRRVADVTQMIHLRARTDRRFLHLDEIADVHVVGEHRAGPDARERPDARARADRRLLDHRIGLDNHTVGYRHVAQITVGADDDVVAE